MKKDIQISFVIPVYNRPDEMKELLESMAQQTVKDFEIVVVEDGSSLKCEALCQSYSNELSIHYFYKENTGPGQSRNYGCERANGNYFIFLDSDCVLPPHYFETVQRLLQTDYVDCFGGPDSAMADFNNLQKAINYSMTSFFTTGGIRGGSEKIDKFHPRSFNMGISKTVFEKTGGFPSIRFAKSKAAGEDMDLSIQIKKLGFKTGLYKEAFVYHKRRTNLKQFYRQVNSFGYARISIYKRHPESLKLLHFAPSMFSIGVLILLLLALFVSPLFLMPLLLHILLIFIDSSIKNSSLAIGLLSVVSSYIQLIGYGLGFLKAFWTQVILGKKGYTA